MLSSILWWRKIITYLSKPKRTRIQHDSSELESNEGEWEEDEFSSLDTADEDADRDDGDVENRIISEKVLSVWSKILPSVQEKEMLVNDLLASMKLKTIKDCALNASSKDGNWEGNWGGWYWVNLDEVF